VGQCVINSVAKSKQRTADGRNVGLN